MDSDLQLTGLHHLTAISADIAGNKRFFTEVLGMRLVKRTVNQDDTSAYHLFYSDEAGSPGNDMTFFDWPVAPEKRGSNSITLTGLRVRDERSLEYWRERFESLAVRHHPIAERDGRTQLDFEDPEGQRLTLVADGGAGDQPQPWGRSPVPAEHQIRGLGPVVMTVADLARSRPVLEQVFGFTEARTYDDVAVAGPGTVHVFEMGAGGPHAELHVAVRGDLPRARPGAGGVHHVAFRTPDEEQYHRWTARLDEFGLRHSGEVDRYYFRSLYYREPNGILFEIATDGPGFAVDEDPQTLGEQVVLPPFLEPRREAILAGLKPID